jgi:hypothetical protein
MDHSISLFFKSGGVMLDAASVSDGDETVMVF